MGKAIVVSGGNGPERTQVINNYIESNLNDGQIIIYDYTYALISYSHYENVSYFCVDTCLSYIDKLSSILAKKQAGDSTKIYIITDAYGGLMFQGNVKKIYASFLKNKEAYNLNILMSCRHLEYIPEDFLPLFDKIVKYDDINGILSNDYFKNLK